MDHEPTGEKKDVFPLSRCGAPMGVEIWRDGNRLLSRPRS